MNRDDIIRMAQEAGFYIDQDWIEHGLPGFERFASLVAAAQREKVAQWMIGRSFATGHGDSIEDLLKEIEWQVKDREREACAKFLEGISNAPDMKAYAQAIRERGEK